MLRTRGFVDPRAAAANLELLTPTPRDAERLAPAFGHLLAELSASADPDMALNNLERYAAVVDRSVFYRTLAEHPGAATLLAAIGGASQFLADALRRRSSTLAWLLEPRTMRVWLPEDIAADLEASLGPFTTRESRMRALRRFKYRHLLRIGARDLLGDADLTATTEDLARLADACIAAAWRDAERAARAQYGVPLGRDGDETGMAVIGMGKLGGSELNYSSDIDLMFVYGGDGETSGGTEGPIPTGDYFTRVCRDLVSMLEDVTDEGYAFRVDLRLRPEGRMGPVILSLDGYRAYYAERAELWERQALLKARISAGAAGVGARFMELARAVVYRPGVDERIVAAVRGMKREIDRSLADKGRSGDNVKLGRGGIREIEFLVQALQLLYGGDDPWLRERGTLRALFRATERGYLAPDLGGMLSHDYVHLRTVEHRLQILHEFQTHTLPTEARAVGLLARRLGYPGTPARAARTFRTAHARVRAEVHRAFVDFFNEPPTAGRPEGRRARVRMPSLMALQATGFQDPERARQNLTLILEGRPLVPYAGAFGAALAKLFPALLDGLWKSPDPDEALNQFERFLSAVGPRAGLVELLAGNPDVLHGLLRLCAGGDLLTQLLITQPELLSRLADPAALSGPRSERAFRAALASVFTPGLDEAARRDRLRQRKQGEELGIVWRFLLGATSIDGYSREMTALAEATLAAGWLLVVGPLVARHGVPRTADGRLVEMVMVGMGKLGGRELTTGSDLDVFVVFGEEGVTDGRESVDAHTFYSAAVERLAHELGDITAAGIAFPVDLRLRPGSKGSGFASSAAALERYYEEYGDLWERQSLTRARVLMGDRGLARRVRAALTRLVYGAPLPAGALKEIRDVRTRMERELAKETAGRFNVKLGRGGLVDVEFLTQALQLVHGAHAPGVRRASTRVALRALAAAGALPVDAARALVEHLAFLRRVSATLRLLGARPADAIDLAGPMPTRVATALGYPSRATFIEDYKRRTTDVRRLYTDVLGAAAATRAEARA